MLNRTRNAYQTKLVDPSMEWTRLRLQILLGTAVVIVLALVGGGVWSVARLITGSDTGSAGAESGSSAGQSAQDRIANQQLPAAPVEAAQPGGELSTGTTGTILIPLPTKVGDVGVATGYPHTPQGALAQLAAIDSTALSAGSVAVAQEVIASWAAPGGPTGETWSVVQGVASLLSSAGLSADAHHGITISVEPKMGLIKGVVGEDFVVPCVDFILTATLPGGSSQQVAAADCQRMVWQDDATGGRWMIGPGEEPAEAPSLWPGTQASFDAGYQWLEVSQ